MKILDQFYLENSKILGKQLLPRFHGHVFIINLVIFWTKTAESVVFIQINAKKPLFATYLIYCHLPSLLSGSLPSANGNAI